MAAANSVSINVGLPATPPTTDDALYKQLFIVYTAINALASGTQKMVSNTLNKTMSIVASEDIPAGVFVNIYNGQARIADAANTSGAGRLTVTDNVGNTVPLYSAPNLSGVNDRVAMGYSMEAIKAGVAGKVLLAPAVITFSNAPLIAGYQYFLSAYGYTPTTAAGKMYQGPPSGSGNGYLRQYLGTAIDTKNFYFNPNLDPYYW